MEGKAALFKEFADIDAYPICVDAAGPAELIAVAKAIARVRGHQPGGHGRPGLLRGRGALRRELDIPVFHDDQHGTAVVVLAAPEHACRVWKGAGRPAGRGARRRAAGIACARLLLHAGVRDLVAALPADGAVNPRGLTGALADALAGPTSSSG